MTFFPLATQFTNLHIPQSPKQTNPSQFPPCQQSYRQCRRAHDGTVSTVPPLKRAPPHTPSSRLSGRIPAWLETPRVVPNNVHPDIAHHGSTHPHLLQTSPIVYPCRRSLQYPSHTQPTCHAT